jgi:hypothetical protein
MDLLKRWRKLRCQISRIIVLSRTGIYKVINKERFTEPPPGKNSDKNNCGLPEGKLEETSTTLQKSLSSHSVFKLLIFLYL